MDLVTPSKETIYFALRNPEHADNLQVAFADPARYRYLKTPLSAEELRKLIGTPISAYYSPGAGVSRRYLFGALKKNHPFKTICAILSDPYYLFRQVRHYTEMAVDIGSRLQFDVIHAHDWLTYPAGMILKKLTGKPLVAHVHATEFDRAGGPGDGRIHHTEYLGLEYADRVITVSNYTARTVAEKYHIDPAKTKTVYNAYSIPALTADNRRIFKEPVVLFMGRITLQKGPDYFLEVARRVLQHEKKVRFVMAGSGDMEREVLHKAAALGLGTRFLFAGFLDRPQVQSMLACSDIFILPSVSEPFGIAPLEAMSQGAVAIISKTSGVAEVIENAYKVDFWDIDQMVSIILEMIKNPEKAKEMAIRGRAEVARLKWQETVEKIFEVFCELEAAK